MRYGREASERAAAVEDLIKVEVETRAQSQEFVVAAVGRVATEGMVAETAAAAAASAAILEAAQETEPMGAVVVEARVSLDGEGCGSQRLRSQ